MGNDVLFLDIRVLRVSVCVCVCVRVCARVTVHRTRTTLYARRASRGQTEEERASCCPLDTYNTRVIHGEEAVNHWRAEGFSLVLRTLLACACVYSSSKRRVCVC